MNSKASYLELRLRRMRLFSATCEAPDLQDHFDKIGKVSDQINNHPDAPVNRIKRKYSLLKKLG